MSCQKCGGEHSTMACDPETETIDKLFLELAQFTKAKLPAMSGNPTKAQVDDACMWYRHDFGLLDEEGKERIRFSAREWLRAWKKTFRIPEK